MDQVKQNTQIQIKKFMHGDDYTEMKRKWNYMQECKNYSSQIVKPK